MKKSKIVSLLIILFLFALVEQLAIFLFVPNVKANPSFSPRTETYVNLSFLSSPYDIAVTKPTGTANGDILFCWIGWYRSPGTTIDSVPTGWNLLGEYLANTDRYALYYKIANNEGASWVWSFAATVKVRAVCSCYTSGDFDPSNPINVVSNTAYRTSDANCKAASMSVSAINSPLIFWGGVYSTSSKTFTKPSVPTTGWIEDDDRGSTTPDFWTEVCSFIWSGSGATGDMVATISASLTTKHAFAVALNAAVSITLTTNPTGCNVRLDTGSWYSAPHTYSGLTPGSSHSIEAEDPYVVTANQEQYIWASWSDTGANPHNVTPTVDTTYTATMTHQWYFSVSSTYDSPTGTGWYNASSSCSGSAVTTPVSGGTGIRYQTTGWTGTGSLSSGGTYGSSSTGSFTINAYSTCTWNWITQYQPTITLAGTTSSLTTSITARTLNGASNTPSGLYTSWSDWCDSGTTLTFSDVNTGGGSATERLHTVSTRSWTVSSAFSATITYIHQWKPTITLTGTTSSLTTSITIRTLDGSSNTPSGLYTSWTDWCDDSTTLTFSDVNTGGGSGTERLHTISTRSWTVTSALTATITYVHQWSPTITLSGTTTSLTVSITVRTLDGSSATASGLYTSWSNWCDDSTTLTFSTTNTGGGSSTERLHTVSTVSWSVTSAFSATITYIHQWKPTITLTGTTSSLTVSITVRTLDGSSNTPSGLYTSWTDWCDDSTTLTFSISNTGGGSSTERIHTIETVSWSITSALSQTITYIHEWKPSITLGGTLSGDTVDITARTLDGSSATVSGLYTSWNDWCDDSTTLTFSATSTSGKQCKSTTARSWTVSSAFSATPIWDRMKVTSYSVSDSRANINDNVNIDATLVYEYDNTQVTTGTITINGYSTSYQGGGVYRITRTNTTVTSVTYNTVAGSETTYGLSTVNQNSQSTTVIWDRIEIYEKDDPIIVNEFWQTQNLDQQVIPTYVLFYPLLVCTVFPFLGIKNKKKAKAFTFILLLSFLVVIVPNININTVFASDETVTVNTYVIIWFRARYDYDKVTYSDSGGSTLSINATSATYNSTAGALYWYRNVTQSTPGEYVYTVTAISDGVYGLTTFNNIIGYITITFTDPPPTYSNVGTNSTLAGQPCEFYTLWNDNTNVSGFIFGTNNTGSWTNETWIAFSAFYNSTAAWSNVTKTLNSTINVVIQWQIWCNDTGNNWNNTGIQTFATTLAYKLNLRVMDWDLTDAIANAYVAMNNETDHVQVSDSNGWANYTGLSGTVTVKVWYFGFWVNGTFSVTMDSDKTIDVQCKLYDVTVLVQEGVQNAYLAGANVTVYNSTSLQGNKITSGVTGNNGQVQLLNLPNNTLTFTQYGGASYSLVIGNTTQLVSSENQTITLTADQNNVNTNNNYSIIAFVGMTIPFKSSFITKRLKRKIYKKRSETNEGSPEEVLS